MTWSTAPSRSGNSCGLGTSYAITSRALGNRDRNPNHTTGLNIMSGDLGNMCALSGKLRDELELKRTGPLLIFATVNKRSVSGDLGNRTPDYGDAVTLPRQKRFQEA